jgi:GNAT superfamily N-acetyltransferase
VTIAEEASPERLVAAMVAFAEFGVDVVFDRVHVLEELSGRVWSPIAAEPLGGPAVVGRGGFAVELVSAERLGAEAAAFASRAWRAFDDLEYGPGGSEGEEAAITATVGGRVVGVVTGRFERGGAAHLSELIVDAPERGLGIGTHLLAAFVDAAVSRACRRVTGNVPRGSRAQAFYEGRGWEVAYELPAWRFGRDFVRLERRLAHEESQESATEASNGA